MITEIYNTDALEYLSSVSDDFFDLIVTDPPYLINYKTNHRKNKEHKFCKPIDNDNNELFICNYIKECYRVLRNNSAMYIFCSPVTVDKFINYCKYAGFSIKNIIIWLKNNHTAGDLKGSFGRKYEMILLLNKGRRNIEGFRYTDVWEFPKVSGTTQLHQNQKPIGLIKRCIESHSKKGDLVFDGCIGVGTTAIACIESQRHFIGCEIDKNTYDLCMDRINMINK